MSNTNTQKQKKNVGFRLLAVLFIVLSVVALFLPFKFVVRQETAYATESMNVITALTTAFASENAPFINSLSSIIGMVTGLSLYGLVAVVAVSVILGIIAIFSAKKAPCLVRTMSFLLMWAFLVYTLSVLFSNVFIAKNADAFDLMASLDIFALIFAVVFAFFYFVFAIAKNGKSVWTETIHFVLTVIYSGLILAALTLKGSIVASTAKENIICFALFAAILVWVVLNMFLASLRIMNAKGVRGAVARYIISILVAIACCVIFFITKLGNSERHIFTIIAAVVAVIQIIIVSLQVRKAQKKALKDKEESVHKSFRVEEYAEAYVYEGGPVAGIAMAKEINPSDLSVDKLPKKAETAGYDFFNCKSFDPFIAMLNGEERRQFTELFILRWKGVMPEIPDYVVGGDNEDFFRKLFIYLGQYRDRIPSDLLAKIYQYSTKQMF